MQHYAKTIFRRLCTVMLMSGIYVWISIAVAATYSLPPSGDDVIGTIVTHTVQHGDNFTRIANAYGVSYQKLVDANPGVQSDKLRIGQSIIIPSRYILPPDHLRQGIVINLAEYRLYYFSPDGQYVHTFPLGVGRLGWRTPVTTTQIVKKVKDPDWTAPKSMIRDAKRRGKKIRTYIPPGPDNPLGLYALRLARSGYLIHGTNNPSTIGKRVSHGCMRMYPADIETLFKVVPNRTQVKIIHEPYQVGELHGKLYFAAHDAHAEYATKSMNTRMKKVQSVVQAQYGHQPYRVNWDQVRYLTQESTGVVHRVSPAYDRDARL